MNRITKLLFCLMIPMSLSGQPVPFSDHYVLNPFLINPAFAGNEKALNISSLHRRQFADNEGVPETTLLTVDASVFDQKAGLGLIALYESVDDARDMQFILNFSGKIRMGNGVLAVGLGAGVKASNTEWEKFVSREPIVGIYPLDMRTYFVPHLSAGIHYSYKNFFTGFSIPSLLIPYYYLDENRSESKFDPSLYNYMLTAGYLYNISEKIRFLPSTLVSYSEDRGIKYDLNAYFSFYDRYWLGASLRDNRSVIGLLQVNLGKQVMLAYSYDPDPRAYSWYSNSSHEIMLRYVFRYKVDVVNPLIF